MQKSVQKYSFQSFFSLSHFYFRKKSYVSEIIFFMYNTVNFCLHSLMQCLCSGCRFCFSMTQWDGSVVVAVGSLDAVWLVPALVVPSPPPSDAGDQPPPPPPSSAGNTRLPRLE